VYYCISVTLVIFTLYLCYIVVSLAISLNISVLYLRSHFVPKIIRISSVVAMLDTGKTLIPCARVLGIVHVQDMYDHSIDDLSLAIGLGVEGSGFGELGIQQ
jgi:hypothetical protein